MTSQLRHDCKVKISATVLHPFFISTWPNKRIKASELLQVWLSLYRTQFSSVSRIDPSLNSQKDQLCHSTIVFGPRCLVQKVGYQQFNKILLTFFETHCTKPADQKNPLNLYEFWKYINLKAGNP